MALDPAPLLRKKQDFAFGAEITTGTALTLTGANAVSPVFNPQINFSVEIAQRQQYGSLSPVRQALGAQSAEATFETEVYNATGAWKVLLTGCGMSGNSGGTYSPIDDATQTFTMASFINGRRRQMYGAMGSWKLTAKRGNPARMQWSFKGIGSAMAAATVTPTYETTVAPVVGSGAFTIGAVVYRCDEVVIDMGNVVILRQDAASASGYRAAYITDRQPKIMVKPEALAVGTQDWNNVFLGQGNVAFSLAIGTGGGNVVTFAAPNLELVKSPQDGDRDGTLVDDLEFLCLRNSSLGLDELTVAFS